MATRWYFGGDATAKTHDWSTRNITYTSHFGTIQEARTSAQTPTSGTFYDEFYCSEDESGTTGLYYGIVEFVTKPLAAQTILQNATFKLRIGPLETNAAANDKLVLEVVQYNSSDAIVADMYYAAGATEFDSSIYESRVATVTVPSNKSISDNDYLRLRVGYIAANTKTAIYSGYVLRQYNSGWSDISDADETTDVSPGTNLNPWIECSQTLTFYTAAAINAKVMVDGAWKTVSAAKVMVDGAWKAVSAIKTMVNGVWKVT